MYDAYLKYKRYKDFKRRGETMKAVERMKELVEVLRKAAYVYEQEDREIMTNYEYDKLYDELKKLEEETGIILAGSITQKVGEDRKSDG